MSRFSIKLDSFIAHLNSLITPSMLNAKNMLLAVSGGVDSMCLAYLMQKIGNFRCLVVNHNLRSNSTEEAEMVSSYLRSKGLYVSVLNVQKCFVKSNIQEYARKKRYQLMLQECFLRDVEYLVTAHHLDDNAETVLLRVMRGTGIDGLIGMKKIEKLNNSLGFFIVNGDIELQRKVKVIRPLLGYTKKEIEATIREANWWYVNDSSNNDLSFKRNKVRKMLSNFDDNDNFRSRLILLSKNAMRSAGMLDNIAQEKFQSICEISAFGYVVVAKADLISLDVEIALRILKKIIYSVTNSIRSVRLSSLIHLFEALKGDFYGRTLAGCHFVRLNAKVLILRELVKVPKFSFVPPKSQVIWDGRYVIKNVSRENISVLTESTIPCLKIEFPYFKIRYTIPVFLHGYSVFFPCYSKKGNHDIERKISLYSIAMDKFIGLCYCPLNASMLKYS